jgi:hypothetical protein
MAVVSFRFVESPGRRQRWWLVHKRMALYTCLVIMTLTATAFLRWFAYANDVSHSPEQKQIALSHWDAPAIYAMGCDDWYRSDRVKLCSFGDAHAAHTALLLGDSIAGQWFPALSKLFVRPGWRLLVLTKSSCPMVDEPFFYSRIGRMYTECATWRKLVLNGMGMLKPDIVIMSSSDSSLFTQGQWMAGSARVMQVVSEAAGQVYVLRGTPHLPFDGPDCLAEHALRPQWLRGSHDCAAVFESGQSSEIYASLLHAASHFDNVHVLDMNDAICPGGVCHAMWNHEIVFRDSQHMTATFAGSLAQILAKKLRTDEQADSTHAGLSM